MPVHDWSRVSAGTYHDFHCSWIVHLKETLNSGLLPKGFYALAEQHAGRAIADILTLHVDEPMRTTWAEPGPIAVLDAPPRIRKKVVAGPQASLRTARRTIAIRHVSNHRVVALIEILSPAKDRAASVQDFVDKVHAAITQGCHLLVIDLFAPGTHDPQGFHNLIWQDFDPEEVISLEGTPFVMVSYVASKTPEAYVETLAVGDALPDMPLFLDWDRYINVPLEATYNAAYQGVPSYWRDVVEGRSPLA